MDIIDFSAEHAEAFKRLNLAWITEHWTVEAADLKGRWEGEGLDEKYVKNAGPHKYTLVKINPEFYRPAEVEQLMGDPTEAIEELGWTPEGNFDTLVEKMVKHDIKNKQKKESYRLP